MVPSSRVVFIATVSLCLCAVATRTTNDNLSRAIAASPENFVAHTFDYLIVGGGTAGLVVASRLSEDPRIQVGVIEAGSYVAPGSDPRIDLISQYGAAFGDPALDWGLKTVPQAGLNGRVIEETVAKVLGGSSMICDVLWQRASREEYDAWGTALGNGPRWSFDALQPYFQKAENWTGPPPNVVPGAVDDFEGLKSSFGTDGPVQISYNNFYPDPIVPAVYAARTLGIHTNANPNEGNATGFSTPARAVDPRTGMRSSAVTAYFEPNRDLPNLLVLTGAQATKVLFADGEDVAERRATGIRFVSDGKEYTAKATREVILSAGTFKTPQLLELSGIGDRDLLEHLGIQTMVDLPGVGENLQDQTYTLSDVVLKSGSITLDQMWFNATFLQEQQAQFKNDRTGALTYDTAVTGSAPMQSFLSDADISSLSSMIPSATDPSLSPLQAAQFKLLRQFFLEGKVGWAEFLMYAGGGATSVPEPDTPYNTPIVFHLYPFARGSVHINTTDPLAPPVIDPQYFSHDFDVTMHALSTAWLRTWMQTPPMAALVDRINAPSEADVNAPAEWENYVRGNAITTFHPIGTAALAPEHLRGVVGPDFKVHRTANLRVVDASVIPLTFSVAPLATVYAIAEKAADEIKKVQTFENDEGQVVFDVDRLFD